MSDLFSAYDLAGLHLKNRIVMAPMTRSRAVNTVADAQTALYYQQRAGAGLIVSEGSPISRQGAGYLFTPGIYSPEQVEGWKQVTRAVHEKDGKIFCQLWHVGRISHVSLQENGAAPVGASNKKAENTTAFAYNEQGQAARVQASQPRALSTQEVAAVVQDFARAAANAVEAGFDGVEIHGANGYLIEQFINAGINTREDRYGGNSVEGRLTFVLEVVDAVVAAIGSSRVGIRLSPFNRGFDMPVFDDEAQTWLELARLLSGKNLAYVHLSNRKAIINNTNGKAFLEAFRKAYTGTLIMAGEYTKEEAERDLQEGLIDLVAFGRPFISNPDLVARLKNGWPLTAFDPAVFYGGGQEGYTDYPVYEEIADQAVD